MEVLGVSYNWSDARQAEWERWSSQISAQFTPLITNPEWSDDPSYVGNQHFEFGAYAAAARMARTSGPFVLVNDTLLVRHAKSLWQGIVKSAGVSKGQILVDSFHAPHERPKEIPNPYASSWLFVIADLKDLEFFCGLVENVLTEPLKSPSREYEKFLKRWLRNPIPLAGYQGSRKAQDFERKMLTIQWEHRLSAELHKHDLFQSFRGGRYKVARVLDRILRRIY